MNFKIIYRCGNNGLNKWNKKKQHFFIVKIHYQNDKKCTKLKKNI